jgi:hypothetical protein
LIAEFEGLIDEFTIIDRGRAVLTLEADAARARFQKIRARFTGSAPEVNISDAIHVHRSGRELDFVVSAGGPQAVETLQQHRPESLSAESLSLEEIFVTVLQSDERLRVQAR